MKAVAEIPNWLSITRVDDHHYQLTDVSVASIGCCLGVFHCREAAESIAAKIAASRVFTPASAARRSTATLDAAATATTLSGGDSHRDAVVTRQKDRPSMHSTH